MNISASSCDAFKACPIRFKNSYILGLKKIETTDALRQGTTWHRLHNFAGDMDAITEFLNEEYENVPENKTAEEWITERTILLYSMSGYNWYYAQQEQFDVIASELKFEFLLMEGVTAKGFIDEVVRDQHGRLYIRERKSTSRRLDDEDYWDRLELDVQVSLYLLGVNYLLDKDKIPGVSALREPITGILYDVWHKPSIRPKFLTQAESQRFVKEKEYCGTKFEVKQVEGEAEGTIDALIVNETKTIYKYGKKSGTFAIYETPEMFGARLLQDIVENPQAHFQQHELSRTTPQMRKFCTELENTAKMMLFQTENELWYSNDRSCESPFRCPYRPLCYGGIEIDPDGEAPSGFEFIYKKGK